MTSFLRRLVSRSRPSSRPANSGGSEPATGAQAPRFRPRSSHPVEIHILGRGSIDVLKARDVSLGGIGVHVPHRFEGTTIDDLVELIVALPGQRSFKTMGRIRHETSRGSSAFFGLQMQGLSEKQRGFIQAYLDSGLAELVE